MPLLYLQFLEEELVCIKTTQSVSRLVCLFEGVQLAFQATFSQK